MHKVKYTGTGGFQIERDRANNVFVVGNEYEVIGGSIYGWSSAFVLAGIEGSWNTALFDTRFEIFSTWDCMVHDYPRDID